MRHPKETALLSALAVVSAALSGCVTPGVTAAAHRDPVRLQEVLARPNHGNEDLDNVLSNSISFDCVECVRLLLKAGVKPGPAPLSAAAVAGHDEIARLLIAAGADPAAALAAVHSQTRKWTGGAGISPEETRRAADLFKKIERENDARDDVPAPAAAPSGVAAAAGAAKVSMERLAPSFYEARSADDYALVVGVEDYEGLPAAAYAERDAHAAADFVSALGVPASHVRELTGARATRAGVAKNIEGWLADNIDPDSTVYFYFAGLGASSSKNGESYLLPADADPRYLELTGYPLKRLYEKMGELKMKRALVILDAGFSGGGRSVATAATKPRGPDDGFNSVDGKIALLAAADVDQAAGMSDGQGHGLFSSELFLGLNGAAKDPSGRVTLRSLADYAKGAVAAGARRAGGAQRVLFLSGGTATDDVVLRARPSP